MYNSEQLLVEDITSLISIQSPNIPNCFKSSNQVLLTEVNLGFGIADIVLTECEEIKEIRSEYLATIDINILNLINTSDGILTSEICQQTGCGKIVVQKSLEKLKYFEYIKEEKEHFITDQTYRKTVKQAIAIEAKLKNWRRALKQAYRYKWFSERSFVCLPHSNIKPAINSIHEFEAVNVGLMGISPDEGISIIYDPEPSQPISEDMSILLNENVLSEINGSEETLPKC